MTRRSNGDDDDERILEAVRADPINRRRLILSSREFVRNFVPPDYLLRGIIQRRYVYSLTGKTGGGKTAITLLLSAHVALRKLVICGRELGYGRVLYLAGENPDDTLMRWITLSDHLGFDPNTIKVHFIQGRIGLEENFECIMAEVEEYLQEVTLVIVDTSTAYFEGVNENDNVEAVNHALKLRDLTKLPGGPSVIVNCHPTKYAKEDQLLPRGGGAFVNEMDGNLTVINNDPFITMHWQDKIRGPDFDPLKFEIRKVTTPKLVDSQGNLIQSVMVKDLTDEVYREKQEIVHSDRNKVLVALLGNDEASIADIAETCGWFLRDGKPYKSKVQRVLKGAFKSKLVEKADNDSHVVLTAKGEKAAKAAKTSGTARET